jgi:hypothetical protein
LGGGPKYGLKHAPLLSLCPGDCCGLPRVQGVQGGCVRRVLKKVPADLILDPVVRSDFPGTDGLRDGRERCRRQCGESEDWRLGECPNDNCCFIGSTGAAQLFAWQRGSALLINVEGIEGLTTRVQVRLRSMGGRGESGTVSLLGQVRFEARRAQIFQRGATSNLSFGCVSL